MAGVRAMAIAMAVLALAACSSGTAKTAAPTRSTSTTIPAETVAQVASKVAEAAPVLRNASSAALDAINMGVVGCQVVACSATSLALQTIGRTAAKLATELSAVQHPPAQIGKLVTQTISAATHVSDAVDQITAAGGCESQPQSDACSTATTDLGSVVDGELTPALDGWKPYGV